MFQITMLIGVAMGAGKHIEMFSEVDDEDDPTQAFGVYRFLDTSEDEFQTFLEAIGSVDDEDNSVIKGYLQNGGEL